MSAAKAQAKPERLPAGTVVLIAANLAVISGATALYAAGLAGAGLLAGGTVAAAGAGAAVKARRREAGGRWRTINGRRVRLDDAGRPVPGGRRFSRGRRWAGFGGAGGARAEGLPPSYGRRPVRRGLAAAGGWLGLPTPARWRAPQLGRPAPGRTVPAGGGGPRPAGGTAGRPVPPVAGRRQPATAVGRRLAGLTRRAGRVGAAWRRWGQPEPARPAAARPQPAGDPQRRKPSPRPRPAPPARDTEIDLDLDDPAAKPEPGPAAEPEKPPTAAPEPRTAPPDGTRRTTGGAMSQTPMLQMQEMADQMVAIATRHEPEGMLEVIEAYRHWPDVLHRLGEAWKIMHRRAQERYPLAPVVVELIEAVHRHQEITAANAEEIAPTAHALHRREIEALENPRNAMWDHRANRDRAAA